MNEFTSAQNSSADGLKSGEREIRDLLKNAGHRAILPAEELATLKAAARAEWQQLVKTQREEQIRRRARGGLALAAGLILAILLGWWWTLRDAPAVPGLVAVVELVTGEIRGEGPTDGERPGSFELSIGDRLFSGVTLRTAATGDGSPARLALRLQGGQSVRMDVDTSVQLLSSSRIELNSGAIYVDTGATAASTSTLEVLTELGIVRHVGSQYEVRLGEGKSAVRVRVREGTVSLDSGTESYSAASGEELTLRRDGSVGRGSVAQYGPEWKWVLAAAPSIAIEGRSLSEFLAWVARETGWHIRYGDRELERSAAEIVLYGSVEELAPDESLSVVLPGAGLDYQIQDGVVVVTRPADSSS